MNSELTFAAALLMGLAGSLHCVGMCGGIVGTLAVGVPEWVQQDRWRLMGWLLAYNAGRLFSYMTAGALAGGLGSQMFGLLPAGQGRAAGGLIAGLFLAALGLYLAGWWQGLAALERAGAGVWSRIEPFGRRLLPVRSSQHAFAVELLWGWLPCGLVYTALAWSLAAGSAASGALLMLAFGIGTLPMLLALGALVGRGALIFGVPPCYGSYSAQSSW